MQELVSESLNIVGEELAVTFDELRSTLERYADGGAGFSGDGTLPPVVAFGKRRIAHDRNLRRQPADRGDGRDLSLSRQGAAQGWQFG